MPEAVSHLPPQEWLLLDELNHRINNELASVIAMVSRTAARSASDDVKRALGAVAERLHRHAEVHHALQPPADDAPVDAAAYLGALCLSLSRSKLEEMNIELVLTAEPVRLAPGQCWRLGMIVSELITNAARHAFAGGPGRIDVALSCADRFVTCIVADTGAAPAHVRPGRGSRIVEGLSRGLGGRIERKFGPGGSRSTLIFRYAQPMTAEAADGLAPTGIGPWRQTRTSRATAPVATIGANHNGNADRRLCADRRPKDGRAGRA
jgi:two-component sensor histidine kinase